jgi:hypothetical protein
VPLTFHGLTRHDGWRLERRVQDAWARGQTLRLHGWVYQMASGLMRPLAEVDGIDGIRALDDSSGLIARAK